MFNISHIHLGWQWTPHSSVTPTRLTIRLAEFQGATTCVNLLPAFSRISSLVLQNKRVSNSGMRSQRFSCFTSSEHLTQNYGAAAFSLAHRLLFFLVVKTGQMLTFFFCASEERKKIMALVSLALPFGSRRPSGWTMPFFFWTFTTVEPIWIISTIQRTAQQGVFLAPLSTVLMSSVPPLATWTLEIKYSAIQV